MGQEKQAKVNYTKPGSKIVDDSDDDDLDEETFVRYGTEFPNEEELADEGEFQKQRRLKRQAQQVGGDVLASEEFAPVWKQEASIGRIATVAHQPY